METEYATLQIENTAPTFKPSFTHRKEYLGGIESLFSLFMTDENSKNFLACTLICRDSKTLLSGGYGTGKTTFIEIAAKMFYANDLGVVRCHQELTTFDILWSLDIQKFIQSKIGAVAPRLLVTSHFKFINEVQRLNVQCQNSLLELLSEKTVTFADTRARSPDYICFLDMNPHDIGTVGLVKALMDRVDFILNVKLLGVKETHQLLVTKYQDRHIEDLRGLAEPVLSTDHMMEIWNDVEKVGVPNDVFLRITMIASLLRKCVKTDRSITSARFRVSCGGCSYMGEICSEMDRPIAHRWIDSSVRLSKAHAWIQGRDKISFEDIQWSLPYILPHRLELKQSIFTKYANETEWVSNRIMNVVNQKKDLWNQALSLLDPALKEDEPAKKKLSELKTKCLAVADLYNWVESKGRVEEAGGT